MAVGLPRGVPDVHHVTGLLAQVELRASRSHLEALLWEVIVDDGVDDTPKPQNPYYLIKESREVWIKIKVVCTNQLSMDLFRFCLNSCTKLAYDT